MPKAFNLLSLLPIKGIHVLCWTLGKLPRVERKTRVRVVFCGRRPLWSYFYFLNNHVFSASQNKLVHHY